MKKLTAKRDMFCREYIVDLNGTAAAERAGYSKRSARFQACELMALPEVQARVQELMNKRVAKVEVKAEEVLRELLRVAMIDITRAYDEEGNLLPLHLLPEDLRHAVCGLEVEEVYDGKGDNRKKVGTVRRLKFWDKIRSLELLGKHAKMWVERLEVEGIDHLVERLNRGNARVAPPAPAPAKEGPVTG